MGQNTSSAVMQQRHEARDSLDDFATPPWATRALCERLDIAPGMIVREPCANRGYMARPLAEFFDDVLASDVHDYGVGYGVDDYLFGDYPGAVDWTIANPPFRLAQQFVERAFATSTHGLAMFLRTSFVEGQTRYAELFSKLPPSLILHFSERVVLSRGAPRDPDEKYWDQGAKGRQGAWKKPSTATSYSWFLWEADRPDLTVTDWIGPCRKRLTKTGDYDLVGNPPEDQSKNNVPHGQEQDGGNGI